VPLSYFRRPLFLVLVLYIGVLAILHGRGFFRVDPPEDLLVYKNLSGAAIEGRVVSPLKEDFRGQKVFIQAHSICGKPFPQKLLAYLPRGENGRVLRPGMPVSLEGRLRLPRPARNPGEFDEAAFLRDRGASWIMSAESLRIVGPVPRRWALKAWAEGAHQSVEGFFRKVLPKDEACVLSGLTMGFKGPLRRDWNRAVQDAGAMHLLVPSGAKVAFIMLAVVGLSTSLGMSLPLRFGLALLAGGFYTLMVGAEAPYTRAFWAGLALGLCRLCGRESGAFHAMTLAALLTLLWEPRELFSAGFQMTYAAVLGLVVAMPRLQTLAPGLPRWARVVLGAVLVSLIVQLMLWPIFADTFARGSLVGILANIVLVPASGLMMAAGFCAWLAGSLSPAAGPLLGQALGALARAFVRSCQFFAAWPGAAVDLTPMRSPAVLTYYLLAFSVLVWPRRRAAGALASAGILLWAGTAAAGRWRAPALRVLLLRLPPAQTAIMTFADGRAWLVDPGTRIAAVLKAARSEGLTRIDRVIVTHRLPRRAWLRLRAGIPLREAVWTAAPWRFCQGDVCFEFGTRGGPRVLRGKAQYSIIPGRLRLGAVEVSTDGKSADIR
jgi:competence protein ComEC